MWGLCPIVEGLTDARSRPTMRQITAVDLEAHGTKDRWRVLAKMGV